MKDEFKNLSIKELLSIEICLDFGNDPDPDENPWFQLFTQLPNGRVVYQFDPKENISANTKLRIKK